VPKNYLYGGDIMYRFFLLLLCSATFAGTLLIGPEQEYENLYHAAQHATAGDTLAFYPGTFSGGESIHSLKGDSTQWIHIKAIKEHQSIIHGGNLAWHFINPEYISIEGFIFKEQNFNGVNIDDGGDYQSPAHHVHIKNCIFRNIIGTKNNDLLKMSGVDHFRIENCRFENGAAGGSGIDMVGCHHGEIYQSSFENLGSNAIQTKGGSRHITIQANKFKNCGQRSINIGGSTGLAYFRPNNASFEAANIQIFSNIFIGSLAPIAFVGCVHSHVINNTIIEPDKWVIRILQESVDADRFTECGENSFQNNIIYFDDISTETNIGPNTRPETFVFHSNCWYNINDNKWEGPFTPTSDSALMINQDPEFLDVENEMFSLKNSSPVARQIQYDAEPYMDFYGSPYHIPRSFGAIERILSSGVTSKDKENKFCTAFPNPANSQISFQYSLDDYSQVRLDIFSLRGRHLTQLVNKNMQAGSHTFTFDFSLFPSSVYVYRFQRNSDIMWETLTILK